MNIRPVSKHGASPRCQHSWWVLSELLVPVLSYPMLLAVEPLSVPASPPLPALFPLPGMLLSQALSESCQAESTCVLDDVVMISGSLAVLFNPGSLILGEMSVLLRVQGDGFQLWALSNN